MSDQSDVWRMKAHRHRVDELSRRLKSADEVTRKTLDDFRDVVHDVERQTAKIIRLGTEALLTDGKRHKQWYLERILEACGVDLEQTAHEMLRTNDREWDRGIAP